MNLWTLWTATCVQHIICELFRLYMLLIFHCLVLHLCATYYPELSTWDCIMRDRRADAISMFPWLHIWILVCNWIFDVWWGIQYTENHGYASPAVAKSMWWGIQYSCCLSMDLLRQDQVPSCKSFFFLRWKTNSIKQCAQQSCWPQIHVQTPVPPQAKLLEMQAPILHHTLLTRPPQHYRPEGNSL